MKKAKIMLMAIAVFGVAGASLAFHAKHFSILRLYCNNAANLCLSSVELVSTFTISGAPGRIFLPTYSTASNSTGPCTSIYVTLSE